MRLAEWRPAVHTSRSLNSTFVWITLAERVDLVPVVHALEWRAVSVWLTLELDERAVAADGTLTTVAFYVRFVMEGGSGKKPCESVRFPWKRNVCAKGKGMKRAHQEKKETKSGGE